jgi:tRNA dimethylallyltransferase
MSRPVLLVYGPTASGKSALALRLAERLDGSILNADSMQLYRELRVLTARPSPEEESRAPHLLYGVSAIDQPWSAAAWRERVRLEIAEPQAAGRLPIVVGGTGMYLDVLVRGLSPIPDVDPSFRVRAMQLQAELGPEAFHAHVAALDPVMAARLPPGDSQRLATGRSLADWQDEPRQGAPEGLAFRAIGLAPPRDQNYAQADRRFLQMLDEGALDEAAALAGRGLDPMLPGMKALGLRPLQALLAGEMEREQAIETGQRETRNYIKRQSTWFRHQPSAWEPFVPQLVVSKDSDSTAPEIERFVRNGG